MGKHLVIIFVAVLLIKQQALALVIPIFDPSNLQQQMRSYLEFIEQNYQKIVYDRAKAELKKRIFKVQVTSADNQTAALIKGLSEAKIKAANRRIATLFSRAKNACDIQAINQTISQVKTPPSVPLLQQQKANYVKKYREYNEDKGSAKAFASLIDNLPPRDIAQVSPSRYYLDELSSALRGELIRSLKRQNKSYQSRIRNSFLYFIEHTALLAIEGNQTSQKRWLLIERSMQTLNDYYAYRMSINQGLLSALMVQFYIDRPKA